MAKRFVDTEKYKKAFIRSLPAPYKLLWDYITLDCNHAGIWHVDFEIAQIYIGKDAPVNEKDALALFNKTEQRISVLNGGTKWLIMPFINFQYGKLNPQNRVHQSIIQILEENKISPIPRPLKGVKDEDKDKNKDKDKEKFDIARKLFPGRKRGIDTEFKDFKKHTDWKECLDLIEPAIKDQMEHRKKAKQNNAFVPQWKHFKTWINQRCWEEEAEVQDDDKSDYTPKLPPRGH